MLLEESSHHSHRFNGSSLEYQSYICMSFGIKDPWRKIQEVVVQPCEDFI